MLGQANAVFFLYESDVQFKAAGPEGAADRCRSTSNDQKPPQKSFTAGVSYGGFQLLFLMLVDVWVLVKALFRVNYFSNTLF
jgi:hypothetical protein